MPFDDRLERALLNEDLTDKAQDKGWLDKAIRAIEQLFQLDIAELFRQAEPEAVLQQESIGDIGVNVTFEGNCAKIIKCQVSCDGKPIQKYFVVPIDTSLDGAKQMIRAGLPKDWKPGDHSSLTWFDDFKDAQKTLESIERSLSTAGTCETKPNLKPSKAKPKPKSKPKQAAKVAAVISQIAQKQGKPEIAQIARGMTIDDMMEAAKQGRKALQPVSKWATFKNIALLYLALATLVTGPAGLASLVLAYLIFKGIDAMGAKPQAPKVVRQDPQEIWNTLYNQQKPPTKPPTKLDSLYQ